MRTLLFAISIATALNTMAQKGGHETKTPEAKAKHRTESMVKDLGLDATQQQQVATINLDFAKAMAEVDHIKIEKDKKGRADVLKGNRDTRLSKVLSSEQYAKMLKLREEHKAEKKETKDKNGSDD